MLEIILGILLVGLGFVIGASVILITIERINDESYNEGYDLGYEHGRDEAIKTVFKKLDEYCDNKKENNNEKDC